MTVLTSSLLTTDLWNPVKELKVENNSSSSSYSMNSLWNPVKELKAEPEGSMNDVSTLQVESGEGIER